MNNNKLITIFGGTGFLGRVLLDKLLAHNYNIKIVSRTSKNLSIYKNEINNGRLKFIIGDIKNHLIIKEHIQDSFAVINLVGILFEKNKGDFSQIHTEAAKNIAKAATELDIKKIIHISALGVDKAITSLYAKSKFAGEVAILEKNPNATIIRPSIIFGNEDNFFNQFAQMAKFSPILPLIGNGITKFQPVFVENIADAIIKILESELYYGKIFELAGTEIVTFKEILNIILNIISKKRILFPIPFMLARIIGKLAQLLPTPIITEDQVELLKYDNITTNNYLTFNDLNIIPQTINEIVPDYLMKYK